jgi:putative intracellular protease/amidase
MMNTTARAFGRFILHFAAMVIAMMAGMEAFMAIPGVMQLPRPLHLTGMGIAMSLPMVLWMKVRGHGVRHGLEMSAAMLLPWAAVLALQSAAAPQAAPWLAQAGSPAMLLGMLAYMLLHREHYARGGPSHHSPASVRRFRLRTLAKPAAYAGAILLVPLAVATANLLLKYPPSTPPPAPAFTGALPAPPTVDPNKRTAVVLSSAYGSEISDTLPPYELLARSGAFNVYSVAPERKPLPLSGGDGKGDALDFVPQLSFASYESTIGRAPDLIVIPYFPGYTAERDAAVVEWIRAHLGPNTTILSICSAGLTLADTGLLEGRTATTNTGIFDLVQRKAPTATLVHGVRYLDDGNIVTSEDLTTGIDATLHIIDRFAGRAAALRAAGEVGYTQTSFLDDPRFTEPSPRFEAVLANAAFSFGQVRVGVPLYDGVSEFGLAGIIDPYGGSLLTKLVTMAPERRIIVGSAGFAFLPRHDFTAAADRVLLPPGSDGATKAAVADAWLAAHPGHAAEDSYRSAGSGQSAYDVTLMDIARTGSARLARATANTLLYANAPALPPAGWPLSGIFRPVAFAALAAAAVFAAFRADGRAGRRRFQVAAA